LHPFGSLQPGRKYTAGTGYRYGFNGKENDTEVKGESNQQDYGMRIYDPRLGRFLSVDPLTKKYPWYTPYQFAGNMPIWAVDLDGLEPATTDKIYKGADGKSYLFGGDQNPQLFTGNETTLQNNSGTKIKPEAGTVRSFTIKGSHVVEGSRRYVASFDPGTGKFVSYGWDKNMNQTYDDYLNEVSENVSMNLRHENDPMWDPDLPSDQAGKRALGLGMDLVLPNPILKRVTVAVNAKNIATAGQEGFKIEGQLTKIWSERNLFVNWLKSKYSVGATKLNATQAQQVIDNARKLNISKIDLNVAGLLGKEVTGKTAGIPHFKIENVHILIEEGLEYILK